jgi:hypothetical protein
VAFIGEETRDHFHMEVAAYPETHRCLRDRIPEYKAMSIEPLLGG